MMPLYVAFFKFLVLVHADDTVVFETDEKGFHNNVDIFFEYSKMMALNY